MPMVFWGHSMKWHLGTNPLAVSYLLFIAANYWAGCSSMECSDEQWSCQDGRRCIGLGYVCDLTKHCGDGSDEWYPFCQEWKCPAGYFKCDDNQCIKDELVCNSYPNCADQSEEYLDCFNWPCSPGFFKCDDGQCLRNEQVCDGKVGSDCTDWSDELHCDSWTCPEGTWQCRDKFQCILIRFVCNSLTEAFSGNCFDQTDEDPMLCANWTCPEGTWRCKDNSTCIEVSIDFCYNDNTQITIAPSVDKGWIVIWINIGIC